MFCIWSCQILSVCPLKFLKKGLSCEYTCIGVPTVFPTDLVSLQCFSIQDNIATSANAHQAYKCTRLAGHMQVR